MPTKPLKPCKHPYCPNLIEIGTTYCEEHQKQSHKDYKALRTDIEEQKFYTSALWRKVRLQHLKEEPLCRMCKAEGRTTLADMVHHIQEIKQDGAKLAKDNLMSLCQSCHMKLHRR